MNLQISGHNKMRKRALCVVPFALLLIAVATTASSDEPRQAIVHPLANANFASDGDPACLGSAVEVGNPSTGPSTILLKADPGCLVPWHFHSAEEQLMVIKGELKTEMASMPSTILGPGGFALIPSKEKHQFACSPKSECLLFLTIDRAFDSAWVRPGN
jgi:quercetin dioxygenase-like cupin family protein